ncbi:MAG: site-specific integrase, partial [Gemmatimonadales bacterium]
MNEISEFVTFLDKERNDSPHTVKAYARDLEAFAAFCERYYGGPWTWAGVDRLAVRGFLAAEQQRGLGKRSVARALSALRTFYRFLNATRGLEVNPARAARTPKFERTLPTYLDRGETEQLFKAAEARASAGGLREARDLAMLEMFYSTGMRLSELAGLNDPDVDLVSDQVK